MRQKSYFDYGAVPVSNRQVFTDYSTLYAHLVAQGPTYRKSVPLYPIGTTSSEENIIGHWGYNSAGAICPMGEVRFTKVTPSQYGIVSALDGVSPQTICTMAGHNVVQTSGLATVWDTTGAVELSVANGVTWTRVGDVFTFGSPQVGLAVGDQVFVKGISEFTIGGATRDIRMIANSAAKFDGVAGLTGRGFGVLGYLGTIGRSPVDWFMSAKILITRSASVDTQTAYLGVYQTNVLHFAAGLTRTAGADGLSAQYGSITAPTAGAGVPSIAAPTDVAIYPNLLAAGTNYTHFSSNAPVWGRAYSNQVNFTTPPVAICLVTRAAAGETITVSVSSCTLS